MPLDIAKFSKMLAVLILSIFVNIPSLMAYDGCPKGVDSIYCDIARETGGKFYNGENNAEVLKSTLDEDRTRVIEVESKNTDTHKYSPYSKDIGCSEYTDPRALEICNSLSDNLEWGWTGHATIAPGWKTNWNSVKNVYCSKNITEADLPVLEKMCGSKIHSYMSCIIPMDARLASGVEFLIKTVLGVNKTPEDLKGTVFDLKNRDYILKDGCQK